MLKFEDDHDNDEQEPVGQPLCVTHTIKDPKTSELIKALLQSSLRTHKDKNKSEIKEKKVTIDEHPDIESFDQNNPFVEHDGIDDRYKGPSLLRFGNSKLDLEEDIETFPTAKRQHHEHRWNSIFEPPKDAKRKEEEAIRKGETTMKGETMEETMSGSRKLNPNPNCDDHHVSPIGLQVILEDTKRFSPF